MGFEINNAESRRQEGQLSLFDYQMPKADFAAPTPTKETSSDMDFNAWLMAHSEPEQSKTPRFVTISAAVHAAAILAIAMMTVPLVEKAKTETIEIEIADVTPVMKAPRGAPVVPTQGGTPAQAETPQVQRIEEAGSPADIVVSKPAATSKKASAAAAKPAANKPSSAAGKNAKSVAAKTTFKAVPMSIDDIEAPELDSGELAAAKVASNMTEDFNEDFSKVDHSQKAVLDKEQKNLEDMANALAAEQDENLKALDEENKTEAAKLRAMQDSLRKRNADTIASALASERAAALAAAAREAQVRKAAQKAGMGGSGNGLGTGQGLGAGNQGSSAPSNQVAGLPAGVRSLDQLRQMPGNPRPQYDRQERLRGDQGEVAFIAYISKEGYPTKFRIMKSTGFRNLDSKTLAALKKWRFYPGQEGWVELPFRWDLKGGVQEDGGLLRRSVSRR